MSIKNEIKEKIPERLQEFPEFGIFLKWVEENEKDIDSLEDVKEVLKGQIAEDQDFLEEQEEDQTEGTNTRNIRPTAKEIDVLKKFEELFLEFL